MTSLPQLQLEELEAEALEEREYPSSDGEPMAESDITRDFMIDGLKTLEAYFENRSDVYVSANSFVYYERGNNKAVVAPDIYVVFGVRKRKRHSYKVWREGGMTPDFVLEITSETTQDKDQNLKPDIYRWLDVKEYFQYDPSGHYLNPILQGVRLVDGKYQPITGEVISASDLSLYSETLGLELCLVYGDLRFRNPQTGELLLNEEDRKQDRLDAEQRRIEAEQRQQEAEQALTESQQALTNAVRQLLKSGVEVEQVALLMQLSVDRVRLLAQENN